LSKQEKDLPNLRTDTYCVPVWGLGGTPQQAALGAMGYPGALLAAFLERFSYASRSISIIRKLLQFCGKSVAFSCRKFFPLFDTIASSQGNQILNNRKEV